MLSARRSCVVRCATAFERDLLVLSLREYLREWPPHGSLPRPIITDGAQLEVTMDDEGGGGGGGGGGSGGGSGGGGGGGGVMSRLSFAGGGSPSSQHLIHVQRVGLTKPLQGPASTLRQLVVTPSKLLHADGVHYCWFRTVRTGGRALIPHATGPTYAPTADDFGTILTVVCIPYARKEAHGGGGGGGGGGGNGWDDDDEDDQSVWSDDASEYGGAPPSVRSRAESVLTRGNGQGASAAEQYIHGKPFHLRLPHEVGASPHR